MKPFFLVLVTIAACKDSGTGAPAPSASASASAAPTPTVEVDTHGKWWAVASKSQVYTAERRLDADNGIRMLPPDKRDKVRRALDDMATQTHDADGLRAASQLAREGQDRVEDVHNPGARNAMTTAGWIVLHGLIALACNEHKDNAALNDLMSEIREMPLPHTDKSNGMPERLILEQEMRMNLDDNVMKAVLARAPPPKKSL